MRFFLFSFALFLAWNAKAGETFQGFVEIEKNRSVYVDWTKGRSNRETLVLLNGLTYDTRDWDKFATALAELGYGVFRYDPIGMGRSLEKAGPIRDVILIENQARDLDLLTKAMGLKGRLHILGLSYGGGLAIAFAGQYPLRVATAFLMAPFTQPMPQQDQWIRTQIMWTRTMFPNNPASDEELYSYFLRRNVYEVYPFSEPSMADSPLKPEAVFQMIQGIRLYDMKTASQKFPKGSVHLMIADQDQYISRGIMDGFWRWVPIESRASRLTLKGSEHKIPEAKPQVAANWVDKVLRNQEAMSQGHSYESDAWTGQFKRVK